MRGAATPSMVMAYAVPPRRTRNQRLGGTCGMAWMRIQRQPCNAGGSADWGVLKVEHRSIPLGCDQRPATHHSRTALLLDQTRALVAPAQECGSNRGHRMRGTLGWSARGRARMRRRGIGGHARGWRGTARALGCCCAVHGSRGRPNGGRERRRSARFGHGTHTPLSWPGRLVSPRTSPTTRPRLAALTSRCACRLTAPTSSTSPRCPLAQNAGQRARRGGCGERAAPTR